MMAFVSLFAQATGAADWSVSWLSPGVLLSIGATAVGYGVLRGNVASEGKSNEEFRAEMRRDLEALNNRLDRINEKLSELNRDVGRLSGIRRSVE
jgi:hypothetical protein